MSNKAITKQANMTLGEFLINNKDYLGKAIGGEANATALRKDILSAVVQNPDLQKCSHVSILNAGIQAYTIGLSILPQLGLAYLVPYNDKCTLQLSYRGMYMLALRSNNYEQIRCTDIREGEIKEYNPISGLYEFTPLPYAVRNQSDIIGYFAYLVYRNGFRAEIFMTIEEIDEHCRKHSPTYGKGAIWKEHKHAMYSKTVLRKLLKNYADISASHAFATGYIADGAVFSGESVGDLTINYPEVNSIIEEEPIKVHKDSMFFGDAVETDTLDIPPFDTSTPADNTEKPYQQKMMEL
ncbi:MAG: recombinase RecT [Desulfovibrionaceae bacterium]|nr:recombinase RecT [Desulfovibrionaceae bacterium]